MPAFVGLHEIQKLADELESAATLAQPIEPPSRRFPRLTEADAYAIQTLTLDRRLEEGETLRGHKIGLTAEAIRRQLGVDEPDYGYLLSSDFLESDDRLSASDLISPMIEAEFAVELSRTLESPVSIEDVAAATARIYPSLEVIDSRVRDWRIRLIDTVADNASCARVVLGDGISHAPPLQTVGMQLRRNHEVAATGQGSDVMGHPLSAVAWLANRLHKYGRTIEAGHVVLSGSLHAAVPVKAGDRIEAFFEGVGSVSLDIV